MTELTQFENKYLHEMANYAVLEKTLKEAKATQEDIKSKLLDAMQEYDLKKIDNDFITITRVASSESTSIDLKAIEKQEHDLYEDLLKDYPKTTTKKESIRIKVK